MAFNYAPYTVPQGYDTSLSDVLGMFNSGMDRGRAQKDDADARTTLAKLAELFGDTGQQPSIPYSFEDPFASVPSQPNVGPLGSAALGVGGANDAMVGGSVAATQGATDPALAAALGGRYGPQDSGIDSYLASTLQRESGGDPNAANPNSSALGPYQFLESTWNGLAQQYPQLGLTPDGRTDPAQNERAMRQFTQDNARVLSSAGIPVNPANLYAAHFLGPQGASEVLGLADNTPMVAAVSPEVISANPFLQNMTVGDFKQWTAGQGGSPTGGYQAPSSQGYRPQIPRELLAELLQNPQTREIGLSFLSGAMKPAEQLKPLEINGRLVNPVTGQVIADFSEPPKNDDPAEVKEYKFYVQQERAAGREPMGYMEYLQAQKGNGLTVTTNPDGTTTVTQGGPSGQKLTEGQSKDVGFYTRGNDANQLLNNVENSLTDFWQSKADLIPLGIGNYLKTPEFRLAKVYADQFLTALLRKDTGAAITDQEFEIYGPMFLPIPGDDPATIEGKRRAREVALLAIKSGLGTATVVAKANDALLGNTPAGEGLAGDAPAGEQTYPEGTVIENAAGDRMVMQGGKWVPVQ